MGGKWWRPNSGADTDFRGCFDRLFSEKGSTALSAPLLIILDISQTSVLYNSTQQTRSFSSKLRLQAQGRFDEDKEHTPCTHAQNDTLPLRRPYPTTALFPRLLFHTVAPPVDIVHRPQPHPRLEGLRRHVARCQRPPLRPTHELLVRAEWRRGDASKSAF